MSFSFFYSSDSSDGESVRDTKTLDLSYLMLDSTSLSDHLKNCVQELHSHKKRAPLPSSEKEASLVPSDSFPKQKVDKDIGQNSNFEGQENGAVSMLPSHGNNSGEGSTSHDIELHRDFVTEKLYLSQNHIMVVPFEIVLYQKLRVLDLSNNSIETVNDFILQIPTLQTLYLKNNQLTNESLPKDMSVLRSIREINLSGNHLTLIPPQLLELSSLRYLYLGNNAISEVKPEIKALHNLQVLHLGGNALTLVPNELGDLSHLSSLVLCNNQLRKLPRAISRLKKLKSLLIHKNNLCCLPVEIVKLKGLNELSIRDNPLVNRFVNCCAKDLIHSAPSLKELAARTVQQYKITYEPHYLPATLSQYLNSGHKCVNPKCKGVYFTSCVEHIKFVDFCGMYRVPLLHYLCSSRCTSQTPSVYRSHNRTNSSSESEEDVSMRKVLLG